MMYKCKHCNELLFYQSSYVFFSSSLYYFSVLDHVDSTKLQDSQYKPSPLSDSILIPLSSSNTEYISKSTSSIPLSDYSSMSILNEDYEQSTPNKFSFPERIVQEQTELLESVQNTIPYAISNEPSLTPKQECSVETSQEEDACDISITEIIKENIQSNIDHEYDSQQPLPVPVTPPTKKLPPSGKIRSTPPPPLPLTLPPPLPAHIPKLPQSLQSPKNHLEKTPFPNDFTHSTNINLSCFSPIRKLNPSTATQTPPNTHIVVTSKLENNIFIQRDKLAHSKQMNTNRNERTFFGNELTPPRNNVAKKLDFEHDCEVDSPVIIEPTPSSSPLIAKSKKITLDLNLINQSTRNEYTDSNELILNDDIEEDDERKEDFVFDNKTFSLCSTSTQYTTAKDSLLFHDLDNQAESVIEPHRQSAYVSTTRGNRATIHDENDINEELKRASIHNAFFHDPEFDKEVNDDIQKLQKKYDRKSYDEAVFKRKLEEKRHIFITRYSEPTYLRNQKNRLSQYSELLNRPSFCSVTSQITSTRGKLVIQKDKKYYQISDTAESELLNLDTPYQLTNSIFRIALVYLYRSYNC